MKVVPFCYDDYDDLFANTYVLVDGNNCLVIDPSKQYNGIINYILKNNLTLKGILLTHGHYDHLRGVDLLANQFNVPIYIGFDEVDLVKDPYKNCSFMLGNPYSLEKELVTVSDQEVLKILSEDIICISIPFHTQGSIVYYLPKSQILFTGDFLFKGSVGRSDLPTGTPRTFNSSIAKLFALPEESKIYPGHGPSSTLKEEKMTNPYLR